MHLLSDPFLSRDFLHWIKSVFILQGSPVVDDSVRFTLFYIQYFLILCALILSCFGEEYREDDRTGEREPLLGQNSKEVTGSDTGAVSLFFY